MGVMDPLLQKVVTMQERYHVLGGLMEDPSLATDYTQLQQLSRERATLEPIILLHQKYLTVKHQLEQNEVFLEEESDLELKALARDEWDELELERSALEQELKQAILPKDPNDQRDVIIEVRAATGGEEAALFAADLYRAYARYGQRMSWSSQVIYVSETQIGGIKEIILEVRGRGAYSRLKHESGVHRVQRVPTTETGGRIHTSTVTVAVLPEPEEVDIQIAPEDLRIDTFRAGGHGGQSVQKTESAVRITHIPTGITAICQDERSQLQNRTKALTVLRTRLYEHERQVQDQHVLAERRSQVGSGERSEKIRTYNFPQSRVTDHRIGLTVHQLTGVMDGDLDRIIDALIQAEQISRLA